MRGRPSRAAVRLNRENGKLCARLLCARNLAVNGCKSNSIESKQIALYKIAVKLGYKGVEKDLKAVGIKKPEEYACEDCSDIWPYIGRPGRCHLCGGKMIRKA
jgi:hypothetical protein